jgi:hypothetical protein
MRGPYSNQQHFFIYVSPDSRVPKDHPLRTIRRMVDKALEDWISDKRTPNGAQAPPQSCGGPVKCLSERSWDELSQAAAVSRRFF